MNKKRRAEIQAILDAVAPLVGKLEDLATEEREAYENLSEGLQQSEQGQMTEAAASSLETAHENLDSAVQSMEEAVG